RRRHGDRRRPGPRSRAMADDFPTDRPAGADRPGRRHDHAACRPARTGAQASPPCRLLAAAQHQVRLTSGNETATSLPVTEYCRPSGKEPVMTKAVIVSAARTPVGSFLGSFANMPAHELGAIVLKAVVERAGVDPAEVSETILGQVLTAAQGQNPARQAHVNAGFPRESAAWIINQVCGSGLRSVAVAARQVRLGDARIVAAGGQESMSLASHAAYIRAGQKMGDMKMLDTMIKDGLWDAFHDYHMGTTAENVAAKWEIARA